MLDRTEKIAVFLSRKRVEPGATSTASILLARWQLQRNSPTIESVADDIPSPVNQSRLHCAAAIDRFGLIHIDVVVPDRNNYLGSLRYIRQAPNGMGKPKWLVDTIDPVVGFQTNDAYVDRVVDDKGRPHIGYASRVDGRRSTVDGRGSRVEGRRKDSLRNPVPIASEARRIASYHALRVLCISSAGPDAMPSSSVSTSHAGRSGLRGGAQQC